MGETLKVALYVRVSTAEQNSELQLRELNEYADRQTWPVADTYHDIISGTKSSRPALNRLLLDAQTGKTVSWYGNSTASADRLSTALTTSACWERTASALLR
jgi:DNA invertase Pin-like site-specific DNA recombinase